MIEKTELTLRMEARHAFDAVVTEWKKKVGESAELLWQDLHNIDKPHFGYYSDYSRRLLEPHYEEIAERSEKDAQKFVDRNYITYLRIICGNGRVPADDAVIIALDTFCLKHKPTAELQLLRGMLVERALVTVDLIEVRRRECNRLLDEARKVVLPLASMREQDDELDSGFTASPRQVILLLRELGLDLTNLAIFHQSNTAALLSKIIGKDKQNIRALLGKLATDNGKQTQKDLAIVLAEIAKIKV